MPSRNSEVLKSFVEYCQNHPEERFWQALRNWSKFNFIYGSNCPQYEIDCTVDGGYVHDTFNIEGY